MVQITTEQKFSQYQNNMERLDDVETNSGRVQQYEGYFKNKEGKELYFRLYVNPKMVEKPGLVAIHGTTSGGATFKKTIKPWIDESEYSWIITPDMPGHGRSQKITEKKSIESFAEDFHDLITHVGNQEVFQTNDKKIDRYVVTTNSGHAAVAVEMYNQDRARIKEGDAYLEDKGEVEGVILQGPVYHPSDTFLGRFGMPLVKLMGVLPIGNLSQIVSRIYGRKWAKTDADKNIQKTRKVITDNKSVYHDVNAMIDWYRRHEYHKTHKLNDHDDMKIAVIHSPGHDNLSKLSEEELTEIHGENTIYIRLNEDEGHHLQKQNPQKLAKYHTKIMGMWGI